MGTHRMKNKSIRRCINKPVRALNKVMDLYVQSMTSFANKISNGAQKTNLATNFSTNSSLSSRNSEEDFSELLKVASTHMFNDHQEFLGRQQSATTTKATKDVVRSQSMVIGRIDEDHVCDFRD